VSDSRYQRFFASAVHSINSKLSISLNPSFLFISKLVNCSKRIGVLRASYVSWHTSSFPPYADGNSSGKASLSSPLCLLITNPYSLKVISHSHSLFCFIVWSMITAYGRSLSAVCIYVSCLICLLLVLMLSSPFLMCSMEI